MGTEYSLVNYRTKECIDLGKGGWWSDLIWVPGVLLDQEGIENVLLTGMDLYENAHLTEYWKGVVNLIWEFVKGEDIEDIIVVNDCDDSNYILRSYGYKWVSSRYNHNTPEELKEYLDLLNRTSRLNREVYYNKEEAIKYISNSSLDINKL